MPLKNLWERLKGLSKGDQLDEVFDDFSEQSEEILQEVKAANPDLSDSILRKIKKKITKDGTAKFLKELDKEED